MATATAAFNESLRTLTEEQNSDRCRLSEDLAAWGYCLHSKTSLSPTPRNDEQRAEKSQRTGVVGRAATKSDGPERRAVSCCHLLSSTGDACSIELPPKLSDWRRRPRRPATKGRDWRPQRAKPTPPTLLVASPRPQTALDQRAATGVDRRRERSTWRREHQGRRRATDSERLAAALAEQLPSLADRTSRWWRPQPLSSRATHLARGGATSASRWAPRTSDGSARGIECLPEKAGVFGQQESSVIML